MELGDEDEGGEALDARSEWLSHPYTKEFLTKVNVARVEAERALVVQARSLDPNYTSITRLGAMSEAFQLVLDQAGVKRKATVDPALARKTMREFQEQGKRR